MKGTVPKSAKMLANRMKKKMIIEIAIGVKTIACQCLWTYCQASPDEKKSLPFNCLIVTRLTAVDANKIKIAQTNMPI